MNTDPFADLAEKRFGTLTDEQKDRAYEKWARDQIGPCWPLADVLHSMFRVIDRLRAAAQHPGITVDPPSQMDACSESAKGSATATMVQARKPLIAQVGETLGQPHADWPQWCITFQERLAYQCGVADGRLLPSRVEEQKFIDQPVASAVRKDEKKEST